MAPSRPRRAVTRPCMRLAACVAFVLASATPLSAQAARAATLRPDLAALGCAPSWEATFGTEPGVGAGAFVANVFDMVAWDDGLGDGTVLFVAGEFTTAGGRPAANIARWDGGDWSALGDGVDGIVRALEVHDDGSGPALYVGGEFTSAGGGPASRVARWDGAAWSTLGSGVDGTVHALESLGGELALGGAFTNAGGSPALRVASWVPSGYAQLGAGFDDTVLALAAHDGGFYAGGRFTNSGTTPTARVARLVSGGSSESALALEWEELEGGVDNEVRCLTGVGVGGGAWLYVGGLFGNVGSAPTAAQRVARWKPGSWEALPTGFGGVNDIAAFDDGGGTDIYATGNGGILDDIARWDGASWTPLGLGLPNEGECIVAHDDGGGASLWVGGVFLGAGGLSAKHLARWDGGAWATTTVGPASYALSMCSSSIDGDPALYMGIVGWAPGGVDQTRLARWDASGWSGWADLSGDALAIAEFNDGSGSALYVGGNISSIDGTSYDDIARWDGSSWSDVGGGVNSTVRDMTVADDGSGAALWAVGGFLEAGGTPVNKVATWDGTSWSDVGGGIGGSGTARCIAVYDDDIYVAGSFNTFGGAVANGIARWDGTSWSSVGGGISGNVWDLEVFDGGSGPVLVAGGVFASAGGVPDTNNLAFWDGTSWSSMGGTTFHLDWTVGSLQSYADGSGCGLYVGGFFDEIGGTPLGNIGRWDGSGWSSPGSGLIHEPGSTVDTLAVHDFGDGPRLVASGSFSTVADLLPATPAAHFVTWGGCWDGVNAWSDLGFALAGVSGDPLLEGTGSLALGSVNTVDLSNAAPSATAGLFLSVTSTPTPFAGGTLVPIPSLPPVIVTTSPLGTVPITFTVDECLPPGGTLYVQWVIDDDAAIAGYALSNAIVGVTP